MSKYCEFCADYNDGTNNFCPRCGKPFEDLKLQKPSYTNAYGLWHVTTEGDVEGRSITDLGVHEGYLDEIASDLAYKCYYSLQFSLENPNRIPRGTNINSVSIALDIESGTWDMKGPQRVKFVSELLKDRKVTVTESNYYASVVLNWDKK